MIGKTLIRFLILIFALTLGHNVEGQDPRPNPVQLEAMKKLHFLVGEWKGEGWNEMMPGQRRTSPITERVQTKLGGMVLLVEGIGTKKVPGSQEEVVVHNALGILSYDEKAKHYWLRSHIANGQTMEAQAKFTDGGFQWGFQAGPNLSFRYTVKLTDKGEWFEIGEMSQDGTTWRKFHEDDSSEGKVVSANRGSTTAERNDTAEVCSSEVA